VQDKRFQIPVRHLRRIYNDPMTGDRKWGIITHPDGGIIGVHSLSDGRPFKVGNFATEDAAFANKTRYSEWHFVFAQTTAPPKPAASTTDANNPAAKGLPPTVRPSDAPEALDVSLKPAIDATRKICEQLVRNDTLACAAVRSTHGAVAGNACILSSNARVEACNATQPVPPLDRGP
jgi:hypothetical protein